MQFQKFTVLDEIKTKLYIEKNYNFCGMPDLGLKIYTETNLFLSVISTLNENWFERDKWDDKTREAVDKYRDTFYRKNYFDYSLIMQEMLHQLETNKEFADIILNKIKYLTVDEYQDTNPIQERLIRFIKQGGCNLCIVGDDDQTIYQFRGSDPENILTFKERYEIDKYIVLGTDYRSTEAVVDIAKRVIVNNTKRLSKVMDSGKLVKYEEGDTVYREFNESDEEYEFIAKRIKALHDVGIKYSEMAVLLRKRKHGPDIAKMLDAYEIPYIIEGVNELFNTAECQAAKGIFDYLAGTIGMMELFQLWKSIDYELDEKEIAEAIATLNVIDVKSKKFYGEFVLQKVYHDFLRRISIVDESNSSEIILYNLGKFSQVINDFETIYYTTTPANKLSSFCNFLKYTADGYYPEGHIANTYIRPDAVNIMTVHQSKGLEFTAVFMDEMLNKSVIRKKKWVVDRHESKQLITSLGTVNFQKTLFKDRESGSREYLLDRLIHMESHERLTEDAVAGMLKEAVQTSYRRGGEEMSLLDKVSKQTVMNKVHSLKFPQDKEILKEKKYVKKLYIDADEDHLSLQYQKEKGDLVTGRYGRKNNSIIAKLVYVYEGIEEETPGSKRHKLINPHYFCSTSDEKDNYEFWKEIYEWIDHHYDLGRIEKIYLNGDGGAWIKAGKDFVDGVITTLDEFHLQKYLSKLTVHLLDSQSDAITTLREIIRHKGKKEFKEYCEYLESYLKESDEEGFRRISRSSKYILDNWMEAKIRLGYRRALPGCSAEGHVSHVLSSRMSSRPMGWSRVGAAKVAQLRTYYYNGGDMLELVKYQRTELPLVSGEERTIFTPTEIMRSEQNRHYELGKYMQSMSVTMDNRIKRHIWCSTHITGL